MERSIEERLERSAKICGAKLWGRGLSSQWVNTSNNESLSLLGGNKLDGKKIGRGEKGKSRNPTITGQRP